MRWVIVTAYVKHDGSAKKHPFAIYTHCWSDKKKKYKSFNLTSKNMFYINNVFWTAIWDVIKKMYIICTTLETWMVSNFKNHSRNSVNLIYNNNNRALIFDWYYTITIILSRVVWTDIISNFMYAAKWWFNCLICAY